MSSYDCQKGPAWKNIATRASGGNRFRALWRHSDGAKIRSISISSKYFGTFFIFSPLFRLEFQKLFVLLQSSTGWSSWHDAATADWFEPKRGCRYDFSGKFKSIRYYFALSQEPRKLIIGIITSTIIICEGVFVIRIPQYSPIMRCSRQ